MSEIETFNDALVECVKAAGGSKKVGPLLFPEKPVDQAQRLLLACLNEERPEKLSPDQALLIMRVARKEGCPVGIEFMCGHLSYSQPMPIEPRDEIAELQHQFIEAAAAMRKISERIEQLGAK